MVVSFNLRWLYVLVLTVVGISLMTAYVMSGYGCYKQDHRRRCIANAVLEESGLLSNSNPRNLHKTIRDLGASSVFSGQSKLGKDLRKKSLPDIIELDYEAIEININSTQVECEDALVALSLQRQVICPHWEMYGLKTDGGWPVCKAAALLPQKPCTVYSFGIRYDWSFDDAYYDAHGCVIRTFDPSMGQTKQHEHKPGVFFYPIGLSSKNHLNAAGWHLETYKTILKRFNNENDIIPYLKFDIETMEWDVLENMMADGVLKNVMQLSFEMHVQKLLEVKRYFKIMKAVESLGFRRWFYHHRLNGHPFQCDQSFINMNLIKKDVKYVNMP